jgi:hypothetical protein
MVVRENRLMSGEARVHMVKTERSAALLARKLLAAATLAIVVAGCAVETHDSLGESMPIAAVTQELRAGDRGPEVEAVFEHLSEFGYFPNERLEEHYPYWAPVIAKRPEDTRYFGPELVQAVRAFQLRSGVPDSGVVDAATLALMQEPRCGNPENEHAGLDPSEKWDVTEVALLPTDRAITWFTSECINPVSGGDRCEMIRQADGGPAGGNLAALRAFDMWQGETKLTFQQMGTCSGTCVPDIELKYYPTGNGIQPAGWPVLTSNLMALATRVNGRHVIAINVEQDWDARLLQAVLGHEVGHVMGFHHSAVAPGAPADGQSTTPLVAGYVDYLGVTHPVGEGSKAVMSSGGRTPTVLTLEDRVGALTLYGTWKQIPDLSALDIGVGGTSLSAPVIWAVASDRRVIKYENGGWIAARNNTIPAARIAVGRNGYPWMVSSATQLHLRSSAKPGLGGWGPALTGAWDVAVGGPSDEVWIVSTTCLPGGGCSLRRYNGSGFVEPPNRILNANAIAIDYAGRPVVSLVDGTIWTNSSQQGADSWTKMDGASPGIVTGCASDVGAGIYTGHFVIGCGGGSDFTIWNYARNAADLARQGGTMADGRLLLNDRNLWIPLDGIARKISVGPDARPYVVHSSGAIYQRVAR